ncbi:HRD3 ERAD-associated E3 ubiquitin-protein ligase component HRD3 [Candida maltosa Xu316]
MFKTLTTLVISLLILVHASTQDTLYNQAIHQLNQLSQNFTRSEIYNIDNIEGNLYIPQFDPLTNDYDTRKQIPKNDPPVELTDKIIPMLIKSATESNNPHAYSTLGDLYLFGNYSLPTDYTRARDYYHKAVEIGPDGHAYFMLGFIYSTGLFGTFPIDQERGNLYYHFGMENGDLNALLVMAYKNYKGIGVPVNCDLSLNYYAKLAKYGKQWFDVNDISREVDYNIRIPDFNGGLYGEKMSEMPSTIEIRSKYFNDLKNSIEEFKLNSNEHEYATLYYNGLENYKGDYFIPKNLTKAFQSFHECVQLGDEIYGANDYRNVDGMDKIFLSACQTKLGRMYLYGLGVKKDVAKAFELFQLSLRLSQTAEAWNDIGVIQEQGLLGPPNYEDAIKSYQSSIKKKSANANKNLAKLLMNLNGNKEENPHANDQVENIFKYMKEAVYLRDTEALYYMGNFLQSGVQKVFEPTSEPPSCTSILVYYRIFIERLSQFYAPHLKYAFEELVAGNFKNSLIGYAIAAEQGLEPAQISAAYLLYQLQPLYSKLTPKTFTPERVDMAIQYLDRASKQTNVDATILLGDIFSGECQSAVPQDNDRAFNYYRIASDKHSSHGTFRLAEMYEYGMGPVNDSVDYFMAKRYYDSSLQYKEKFDFEQKNSFSKVTFSKSHIDWALLRLRFKYLFNRKAFTDSGKSEGGWLSAFNTVSKRASNEKQHQKQIDSISKAEAHHEGTTGYGEEYMEDYDVGDYLVIALTFTFFMVFFVQNIVRQIRRMRNGQNNNNNNQNENENANGWNGNQFNFRRGNFEFHFFAI